MRTRRESPPKVATRPSGGSADAPPPRSTTEVTLTDLRQRGRSEFYAGPYDDADRYRLIDRRSRGGEGELWRGVLPLDSVELPVAVKVIHPSNAAKLGEWRQRWQRQAELLRSCDHPGLVKVRDVFEGPVPHELGDRTGDRSLYLVMNWVEGPSVDQWVELAPQRSTAAVLEVASQVAGAIDHLHAGAVEGVSVIHRDIKPGNVVLGPNGPCLVDFGFVRLDTEEQMTLVGTPPYVAPEVITSSRYSPATDRFAFGGTVFYTLTGQRPDLSEMETMRSCLGAVDGFHSNSAAIESMLAMLARNPGDRPDACSSWIEQLRELTGAVHDPLERIYPPVVASGGAPGSR